MPGFVINPGWTPTLQWQHQDKNIGGKEKAGQKTAKQARTKFLTLNNQKDKSIRFSKDSASLGHWPRQCNNRTTQKRHKEAKSLADVATTQCCGCIHIYIIFFFYINLFYYYAHRHGLRPKHANPEDVSFQVVHIQFFCENALVRNQLVAKGAGGQGNSFNQRSWGHRKSKKTPPLRQQYPRWGRIPYGQSILHDRQANFSRASIYTFPSPHINSFYDRCTFFVYYERKPGNGMKFKTEANRFAKTHKWEDDAQAKSEAKNFYICIERKSVGATLCREGCGCHILLGGCGGHILLGRM